MSQITVQTIDTTMCGILSLAGVQGSQQLAARMLGNAEILEER